MTASELNRKLLFCGYDEVTDYLRWSIRSCSMVDMIVPAILRREAPHQTINIPTVQQLNINPQNVINQPTDDNETIDPEPQT